MQQIGTWIGQISALIAAIKASTNALAGLIEIFAALVIGIAALQALGQALVLFWHRNVPAGAKEDIRLRFARWLAVALEFELGADILRTAVTPDLKSIGQLAAIAAIRTALNYFLEKEIQRAAARQVVAPLASPSIQHQQREQVASHDERTPQAQEQPPPEGQRGSAA